MPRDKNPSLGKTCLLCRQKLNSQLKFNASVSLDYGEGGRGEEEDSCEDVKNVSSCGDKKDTTSSCDPPSNKRVGGISRWRALCLETFSMLFGLPVNHPFTSIFVHHPERDELGQMCNRCLQDVSNVHFTFWQLQSLERKLSELQQLIFDRLKSNYEALPVGLIFGKFIGVEELRRNLHNLKFDEIVKILFEEIKSHKDVWPTPTLGTRWTEACQNSERISYLLADQGSGRRMTDHDMPSETMLPDLSQDESHHDVKIEVDPASTGFHSGAEIEDYQEEPENVFAIAMGTTDLRKSSSSKRTPTKNTRYKHKDDEHSATDERMTSDHEEDDDTEWIVKKNVKGGGVKNSASKTRLKSKTTGTKVKTAASKPSKHMNDSRFLCTEDPENCTKTYSSKKHLRDHIEKFHKARKFECEEDGCVAKFKSETSLILHREKVHLHRRPKEICELCGLEFEHKEMRKHYYLKHHGVGKFKCELCSMDFMEESDFQTHEQLHQSSAEYPFLCVICQQLFTNSMDLKSHVTSNHLRSGLKCNICGIMKPNDFLLQRHLKIHDRVKTFICGQCGKAFSTYSYLRYHEDHYHTNATRRFPCEVCGKEFKHEKNVMRHLVSHQEEKPFKCKICSKTFNYSHLLKKHEEIHSGTKNYECHLCGKRFKQEQNLRQHMKSHRPKPEKRKRSIKLEEDEEEQVEEISYEIHQDEGDKDSIPVILQVKGDIGGMSSHFNHHQVITTTTTSSPPPAMENVIEATIIPAAEIGEDGNPTTQYETVQEIQLHHSQDLSQSQTATVVFLYEYNA